MESNFHYVLLPSAFGAVGIVWQEEEGRPLVHRLFLTSEKESAENLIQTTFIDAENLSCAAITELGRRIQSFLRGKPVDFELEIVALETCSKFQQRVLLAEYQIPRGWVSSYGRIAGSLGMKGGARAVGRALSHNPFPIIVPCHRAIRSDGELGGFQGGLKMKRTLLELEGIQFSRAGRVLTSRIYY